MLDLLVTDPLKLVVFFVFVSITAAIVFVNMKNPKRLLLFLVFYIPLSFKTNSGSLSLYLAILLFVLLLFIKHEGSEESFWTFDSLLVVIIFLASILSILFAETHANLFVLNKNMKIMINPRYMLGITMLSNIVLYLMLKRFITNKDDIIKALKYIVISGTVATAAAYLQILNRGLFLFKYIVVAEHERLIKRIAGTMQGYEMLAEYTAILLIFAFLLLFLSEKRWQKVVYAAVIINFGIVMTLTQTRGIYVAIAITMFYFLFLFFISGQLKIGAKYLFGIIGIMFCMIVFIFVIDQLRPEARFIERFERFERIDIEKGKFDTRNIAWQRGINYIKEMSPKEKIIGANNKYLGQGEVEERVAERINWPHCLYMSYILRDGYLGLSLFLIFIAWLYKGSIVGILRQKTIDDKELFMISVALHMALIIFVVDEIKIEFIRHDRTQNIYWVFFGLISTLSILVKKRLAIVKGK